MKPISIHIQLKEKSNTSYNKILELFKLSAGNNIISLNYDKNNSSNQNLEISYYKKCIKKNIGKMIYERTENKEIKIFNDAFVSNNMKRAKIIINNKQYKIKENIENQLQSVKIKIKFLDNIIKLNSMFSNCKSLYSIHNFKNLNTK